MGKKKLKTLFTEDMALNILTRLPVKSAIRFSFVSKDWRSRVISNAQFATTQLQLATHQQALSHRLLVTTNITSRVESLELEASSFEDHSSVRRLRLTSPFHQSGCVVRLLGSCNGLVLVCLDNSDNLNFSVWNPTTGFLHHLPHPGASSKGEYSFSRHGFGYVSSTKDYKIIISYYVQDGMEFVDEFSVLSLKSNSWKRIADRRPSSLNIYNENDQGVLSNETLHWLDETWEQGQIILAFDLAKEEFKELPVPIDAEDYWTHIGAFFGGCLCLARDLLYQMVGDEGEDQEFIEVYVMKEYGVRESWTRLFKYEVDYGHNLYDNDDDVLALWSVKPILYKPELGKVLVVLCYGNELIRIEKDDDDIVDISRQYEPVEPLQFVVRYEETLISLIGY